MATPRYVWMTLLVSALLLALAAAVVAVVLATRRARQGSRFPAPMNLVARAPARPLTKTDALLARLLNAIDADMRSIQLGRWFVASLRARAPRVTVDCDVVVDAFDYDAIAARVPRMNAVTHRETVATLRALVTETAMRVCDTPAAGRATPSALARALDDVEESAFGVSGVLLGMPGYSMSSRLPLPAP